MSLDYGISAPDEWFQRKINQGGGVFDRASFDLSMQHVKGNRCAIDCGAHVGSWSVALAKRFKTVFAFEADIDNYKYLESNANNITNIEKRHVAIGESNGFCDMGKGHENSGQSHVKCGGSVLMESLDQLMPNTMKVDFIKFDIEGYEYFGIKGASEILKRHKPVLCVELNGLSSRYGKQDTDVLELLKGLGYSVVARQNKDYILKAL